MPLTISPNDVERLLNEHEEELGKRSPRRSAALATIVELRIKLRQAVSDGRWPWQRVPPDDPNIGRSCFYCGHAIKPGDSYSISEFSPHSVAHSECIFSPAAEDSQCSPSDGDCADYPDEKFNL